MILSKTGSLYQQPNLFHFFLSTSSVLEHELKTHISDVLKTVYLLLMQIGCFHIYKNFFQSCNKSHLAVQIWCGKRDTYFSLYRERGCDFETIRLPSFFLISSAVDGNENAIEKLLLFYEAYISKCCLRPFYDEYGNVYIVVDMELKGRIREALLKMICEFEIDEH